MSKSYKLQINIFNGLVKYLNLYYADYESTISIFIWKSGQNAYLDQVEK